MTTVSLPPARFLLELSSSRRTLTRRLVWREVLAQKLERSLPGPGHFSLVAVAKAVARALDGK